jgi:hypothetical protein
MPGSMSVLQAACRSATGSQSDFNGDLHALFDSVGIPAGDTNGRMIDYVQRITGFTDVHASPALNWLLENAEVTGALPTLGLNFAGAETLDSRITFARASIGTRVNASGFIETLQANQPRFDYDPGALQPRGLLIEEARTNLILASGDLSSASWFKAAGSAVSEPAVLDPSGGPAWKYVENTALTDHYVQQTRNIVTSAACSFSFFIRAAERTRFVVILYDSVTANNIRGVLDLALGTFDGFTNAGTATGATGTIVAHQNNWFRVTLSGVPAAVDSASALARVQPINPGTTYQGDGISGFHFWGGQLEAGAFPTTYIPTTGAAVTRNADVAVITGANFSGFYDLVYGSFVLQVTPLDLSIGRNYMSASNGTSSEATFIGQTASNPRFGVTVGGLSQVALNSTPLYVANELRKLSAAYALDDFAFSSAGSAPSTDASGLLPAVDRLYIGASTGGGASQSVIKSLAYFPRRLSDTQLRALSA